jgi:hypothetical protein
VITTIGEKAVLILGRFTERKELLDRMVLLDRMADKLRLLGYIPMIFDFDNLDHEYSYVLDPEQREALVQAISRYERDRFLDGYYSLFGPLDHFVRTTARKKRL